MNKRLFTFIAVVFLLLTIPLVANAQGCSCPLIDEVDSVSADFTCDHLNLSWSHGEGSASILLVANLLTSDIIEIEAFSSASGSFSTTFNPPLTPDSAIIVMLMVGDEEFDEDITAAYPGEIFGMAAFLLFDCGRQGGGSSPASPGCADGRLNAYFCDQIAVYPEVTENGIGVTIYTLTRGSNEGHFALYLAETAFNSLPESVTANCTIDHSADGTLVVYLLTSGEIQINVGPDAEGKVYVYIFRDLLSAPVRTDTYTAGQPPQILPACV